MSHGGLHLDGGGGDGITLSAISATGQGEVSVAFDYTAESLAAHDSPSGTGGFLYTVPSPSPTAPSCSLRLSGANGSGSGPQRALRSPTVVGKGRRLEWDTKDGNTSSSGSSSSGSRSSSNTPVRPQLDPGKGERYLTGLMGATSPGVGGLGSLATDCNAAVAEGGATAANTRTLAQQPRGGGAAAEANTATAPLLQDTPAAGRALATVGPVTPTRTVEEQAPAAEGAGGGAGAGAPPRSAGSGLFTALLDNISLSQIMQSQGTTQGTTGTQGEGEHAGGGDAEGGNSTTNTNSSSSSGNKPVSPSGARGAGSAGACAQEEGEEDEARQHRGGGGGSAVENSSRPADNGEAADTPQGGGLWSASRLGPLSSLALQDSEDDFPPVPRVGVDATGQVHSTTPVPCQSCTATDGACCDRRRRQQQKLSPPGGGDASATAAAGGRGRLSPARSSSGTAPAKAVAEALLSLPPISPPAAAGIAATAAAAAAAAAVSVADPSPSPAGLGETAPHEDVAGKIRLGETAPHEDVAGKILPVTAAPPVGDESLPVQREESDVVGLPAPVGLQEAADGGEREASPTEAVAREACDGGAGGKGADAAAVADDGFAGVVAGNRSEHEEDSPAFSAGSSLNLALSLTPECKRIAAAQARKDASAEHSARDSIDSCVSSLCFELPSSVPPSNCSKESAISFMTPQPRDGEGHAAAAAAARGGRARGAGSSSNRSSNGSSSAAESDSPWPLRALSSADLSPVSPRQTPHSSPAAAAAAAVGAPPSATRNGAAAASADSLRVGVERMPAALSAENGFADGLHGPGDSAHGTERGGCEDPRRADRPGAPVASKKTPPPPTAATSNGDGETSVVQMERARCTSQEVAPRLGPASLEAARPKLPGKEAEEGEEEEETADGPGAEAGRPPRGASDSESLLRGGRNAKKIVSRHGGGRKSSGPGPVSLATGDAEHVEPMVVISGSGSGGGASGSGDTRGSSENGGKQARSTPPNASMNVVVVGSKAVASAGAGKLASAAVAIPPRASGNVGASTSGGGGGGGGGGGSSEKTCFTNGAPLTNWAAGVCGRGELLSYPGEGQTLEKPPAPAPAAAAATTRAAADGDKASTNSISVGDPVATAVSRREERREGKDVPGTTADVGLVRRGERRVDGGPPRRAAGEAAAQGLKLVTSSISAQQLIFTSEEESCGSGAPGNAGDSVVTEKLFATPPPPAPPAASTRVGVCCDPDDRGRSVEAGRAIMAGFTALAAAGAPGARAPAAQTAGRSGWIADQRRREEGELSPAMWPPRSPVAALTAVAADKAPDPLSPLAPSPDATQTPGRDGTRAAIMSATAKLAKPPDGAKNPSPSAATDSSSRPSAARRPAADKGKARNKAGEVRAATTAAAATAAGDDAGEDAPDPRPAAAATLVPARPSVGGWISSRRVEGFDNSTLMACSGASLSGDGGGGTATQSPDLLAHPPGLRGTTAAAARAGPGGRGGSSARQPPPCRAVERCRASGVGGRSDERGARSTTTLSGCDGVSSGGQATAPRGGGGGGGSGGGSGAGSACAAGAASAEAVVVEGPDEARGGKRTRGGSGGVRRTVEHARSRGLAIGDEKDQEEARKASSPALEIISPDDIEQTPPSAAPKKRLKARKLTATAESLPAATLPAAAPNGRQDGAEDGEEGEGRNTRRRCEPQGEKPGEKPGDEGGQRREENEETEGVDEGEEEEEEREADGEAATLTDTDTEEPVPAPQAAEEHRQQRHTWQQQHQEGRRDATAGRAWENALAPPVPIGKASAEGQVVASTSAREACHPAPSGHGAGSFAATRSGSHLRRGLAAPQPPEHSGSGPRQVPLQSAASLFFFWHQAWVRLMLARRRRERRHASFLAARMRWNKARSKKGSALVAKLNRAKKEGAPLEEILKVMAAVRNTVFRYDPVRDQGGDGYIQETRESIGAEAAARSSPPAAAGDAPSLESEHGARTSAAAAARAPVGGGGSVDNGSTVPPAVAARSGAGAAGVPPAREAAGQSETSLVLEDSRVSPARVKKAPTSRRRCETSSGQRLRRAATLPSPPRPVAGATAAERTAIDAGSTATAGSSRASSRLPSSSTKKVFGNAGDAAAAAADTRGGQPTADQLNDPVYRGMMKARARAAKAAAASCAGGGNGLNRQSSDKVLAGKAPRARRTEEARRESRGDQRQGCGGWFSSRRRDWALDDVFFPPAPAGVGSSSSSSSRRLSRSKSAPCDSPPPPPQPRQPTSPPPSAAKRKRGPEAAMAKSSTNAPASLVGNGERGEGSTAAAVSAPTAGCKGTKQSAAARGEAAGGGGGDELIGSPGTGGAVGGPRTEAVGPRSHAKKESRGGVEGGREAAEAVRAGSAATATATAAAVVAATAAAKGAAESALPPTPSKQPKRTGASVCFHGVSASAGEDSASGERSAKKVCRRPCTRKSSAKETACVPAAMSPATTPRTHQQQRRCGPRGQEMFRQATAQAAAGDASASATERTAPVRDSAAGVIVPRSGVFYGLGFVLVGLPDLVCRHVEGLIVAGGGRVLEDIPPPPPPPQQQQQQQQPRERFGWLPPAGAVATTAADAARRGRRSRDTKGEIAVVVSVPTASRLPRYVLAIAMGTLLLHHFWVSDSAAEGRALPPAPYLLPGAREASRRRQALACAAGGDGGARGGTSAFGHAAAAKAGGASRAAALAKVVTKTGTPLTGMAIGVAHACPTACERWARVLSAAGAQTVRPVTGDLLLGSQEETGTSPSKSTHSCGDARARAAPEAADRGDCESSPSLQAAVAGLDCVLCDYPGAWSSFSSRSSNSSSSGGGGGKSSGGATPARPGPAGGENTHPTGSTGTLSSHFPSPAALLPTTASLLSSLGRVVDAGRRRGVPVVSLSWAIDCVVRGSRVRQQARPEYLSPFLDDSLPAAVAAAATAGDQGRFGGLGARAYPMSSAVSGRRAPPSSASPSRSAGATRAPVHVFVSRAGVRYEVNDHVYVRAQGAGDGDGGARRNAVSPPATSTDGGRTGEGRHPPETAVGRIVHLERAASSSGGRVVATLEPLQRPDNKRPVAAATASGVFSARGVFHVGCGGGFASPSTESSVSRGRARRARELKKVVLAEGAATRSSGRGRQSWQKIEAAGGLLGRVSVLSAREFDARRGFCGRDPGVFAQQRVATSWATPL